MSVPALASPTLAWQGLVLPGNRPIPIPDGFAAPGVTLVEGPAGSGKSLFLRVLATLAVPRAGRVRYPWPGRDGSLVTFPGAGPDDLARVRGCTGYVPQEGRVLQGMKVASALAYLAALRAVPDARQAVAAILARWGLAGAAGQRLEELSGGQWRRWLLAQSQLTRPALWILDEPARGLDHGGVELLREALEGYRSAAARGALVWAVVVDSEGRVADLADQHLVLSSREGWRDP
ncbi:ABC transporter related protein [Thermaerobacter marianensis DSM 12885]|uniref:ABC transporter related protein n=1 Tax=Thermaerobacter marianensis (strain ATCC 700841 / DSM 12885 / JCM 10246 / 7p75a) TaxID=644966 RepID=E6SH01_THEM7|nr:ATP-binding cassette domain-containing protein [Thermaerobacter marianensis]ADU50632.1 ABC transporter related protein [Thermaerobacter marianensis DSM 12885]